MLKLSLAYAFCLCLYMYIHMCVYIPIYIHHKYDSPLSFKIFKWKLLEPYCLYHFFKNSRPCIFHLVVYLVLHFITHVVFQHCIFRNYVNALYVKMCDVCIWKVYFKSSFESQYQVIGLYSMSVPSWFHTSEFKSLEKG